VHCKNLNNNAKNIWLFFRLAKSNYFRHNLTSKKRFRRIKMANIATTKMSSKGQVVIPEVIRKRLDLKAGSQFIVVGEKDVVIFKSISQPSIKEFDKLISQARKQAKEAGLKRSDVHEAIAKARGRK
jgi:AbrB family looped-hinge helix DNA binding protein